MTSTIKVNNIQNQCGQNIINENSNTITIGASGDTIALASGASQSGFGRTGTVDWQTGSIKTANFVAANGEGYFVDTTSGAVSVTLPSSPAAGNIVAVADYAGTSQTSNINILRNSSKIEGGTTDAVISSARQTATLVYVDATQGWLVVNSNDEKLVSSQFICATGGTEVTCGNFKTHIFTGPGTFTISCTAPGPSGNPNAMDYIVVAGGAGAPSVAGGGGGAGGFRLSNCASIPAPTMSPLVGTALTASVSGIPISVGGGGAGGTYPGNNLGAVGGNSIFSTITSAGGGPGGARGAPSQDGIAGGSGGGGAGEDGGSGGAGNTPSVSPPQGNSGGAGGNSSPRAGGGGGGAAAAGGSGVPSQCAGPGGAGSFLADAFVGPTAPTYGTPGPVSSTRYFAGGGGGGVESTPGLGLGSNGAGGVGGGGGGGPAPTTIGAGTPGTVNTGGGGGGASRYNCGSGSIGAGGAGGSGIVMIRYKYQ